jgi:hypothetical protein
MNPPRLSEAVLRLLLIDRDRETVSGDLLEEYREVILPARGPAGARRWYRQQVAGFVWRATRLPLVVGLAIGLTLGVMNLIGTAHRPLADDDGLGMFMWLIAVLAAWTLAAVGATWRARRMTDAVTAGAVLGIATIVVFHAASIVRVNMFLDLIQHRDDWQNLVARYHHSGFVTLRAYANYEYLRLTPMVVGLGAAAGSISGALAGSVNRLIRASGASTSA